MQAQPVAMALKYIDRPEVSETFADSVEKILIDQSGVRLEFVVNRLDEPKPPAPPTGKKYTTCRVVMPLQGFFEMVGKFNGLMQTLQQQGVIKPIMPAPSSSPGKPN